MPSFDVVSQIDNHELTNAIDQANREVENRFDFKGSNAKFNLNQNKITMLAPNDFQLKQMNDVLRNKLAKREVDVRSLKYNDPELSGQEARQEIEVREGITKELGKKIVKLVKETKLKVQAAIQGEQVRVTGKKRDDLQSIIELLRKAELDLPLQFINFRD